MTYEKILLLLLVLILINSFFAICEFSIATSRRIRLQQMEQEGNKNAGLVLSIINSPSSFITTIQVGLNLVAILSGVFAEEKITHDFEFLITGMVGASEYTYTISFIASILLITSIFIVFSELIPKKFAYSNPEKVACIVVKPLLFTMKILKPLVATLAGTADVLLKFFRIKTLRDEQITFEDVSAIINESAESGLLVNSEHKIIKNVFSLEDRNILTAITQRNDIIYFDINEPQDTTINKILEHPHARFIVCDGELDKILGYIESKDILGRIIKTKELNFNRERLKEQGLKPVLTLPDSINLLEVLDKFRETKQDISCVFNEFGMLIGIITLNDVLSTLMGDVVNIENSDGLIVSRDENSWIVDGRATFEEVKSILGWEDFQSDGNYETISGFLMYQMKCMPKKAQKYIFNDVTFEIIDVDGYRIDDVLIIKSK